MLLEGIERSIEKCQRVLATDPRPDMRQAIEECLCYWANAKIYALANPDAEKERRFHYGLYVVVRVSHRPSSDEWTNIGIMIYDRNNLVFSKIGPFQRARQRGDLTEEQDISWITDYAKPMQTIDDVYQRLHSTGHMMSCVQMTEPRAVAIEHDVFWSIYQNFVLGIWE
jgi:hypothetical protein